MLPGLPYAFVSASNNYITSIALRSAAPPSVLQIFKRYYKGHVDEIRHRLNAARELGKPSAEEWFKGLEMEGKERLDDVVRWEQWEAKGGLRKVNQPHVKLTVATGSANIKIKSNNRKIRAQSDRLTPPGLTLPVKPNGDADGPAIFTPVPPTYPPANLTCESTGSLVFFERMVVAELSDLASFQPWVTAAPYTENNLQRPSFQTPRPERSIREVNEAKASRRLEIERRCAALDPPLLSNVLVHMEAFQAAVQISQPLNDQAWHVLKPRLLTQRAYAERREIERTEQSQLLQAEHKQRRVQEAQLKETREILDREWDSMQIPIRNQIARLAEERIDTMWTNGKSVTKDNCPKFAADVLLYVRQKFYDEIAQENEAMPSIYETTKLDPSDRPASRILNLENMKWLFDSHIKPLTENFQKELFLCNGCDGNFKFYGLESVVQHYAAKHTTSLSLGNQVVHWRAEWPEHPPFHPEPSVAKAAYYKMPTPIIASVQGLPGRDPETLNGFGGFGQHPSREFNSISHFPIEPYKGPYKDFYVEQQEHQNRNYSPSLVQDHSHFQANAGHSKSFYPKSTSGAVYPGSQVPYHGNFQNNGLPSSLSDHVSQGYNPPFSLPPYSEPSGPVDQRNSSWYGSDPSGRQNGPMPIASRYRHLPSMPTGSHMPYSETIQIGQPSDIYQHQVEEMARHARDVWALTSGIKDIPQSVRIFVVIQQTIARFREIFLNEPSLSMFMDGLDNNGLMRPIKSLKGLACKVCVTTGGAAGGGHVPYTQLPVGYRSLHTLPELLNHFKTVHVESCRQSFDTLSSIKSPGPDWKFDMIELPEPRLIADLINAQGMDDTKLELIARIFPAAFPSPLPQMGSAGNAGPVPIYTGGVDTRLRPLQGALPEARSTSPSRPDFRYENSPFLRPYSSFRERSQPARLSEPPGEDEYDPHRPADLGKIVPSGLASSHARKSMRTSPTVDDQLGISLPANQDYPYMSPDIIDGPQTTHPAVPLRTLTGDDNSNQQRQQGDESHTLVSVQGALETLSEDRYEDRPHDHRWHRTHGEHEGSNNQTHSAAYSLVSEDPLGESSVPVKSGERTLSPHENATAADEFLDNLASTSNISLTRKHTPIHREDSNFVRKQTEPSPERQWHRHGDIAPEDSGWRVGNISRQRRETELPSIPSRTDSGRSKHFDELQTSLPDHNYDERSRSKSQVRRSTNGTRIGRSTETYSSLEAPTGMTARERYEISGDILEPTHIRDGIFREARTSHYRSRSSSPRAIPARATYYRARSPVGRVYGPVYHVRSPSGRDDVRPQRVISYEHPTHDQYEYIDQHRAPERQYRQRIEYVPVRVGEHAKVEPSRVLIAQSPDIRPLPDYVRLNRDYGGGAVYEHHGQLYHTDSRPYHAQPNFGPLASPPGYRY